MSLYPTLSVKIDDWWIRITETLADDRSTMRIISLSRPQVLQGELESMWLRGYERGRDDAEVQIFGMNAGTGRPLGTVKMPKQTESVIQELLSACQFTLNAHGEWSDTTDCDLVDYPRKFRRADRVLETAIARASSLLHDQQLLSHSPSALNHAGWAGIE